MSAGWEQRDESSVLVAFTPLRRVGAGESPYRGTLVRAGAGVHLLLDPDEVPASELFWTPREDSHVLRAWDVVHPGGLGQDAGPAAVVEACREPLEDFLNGRAVDAGALSPGECTTIAVGLLRGLQELREGGEGGASGRWWLTSTARPVFVLCAAGVDGASGAVEVLRLMTGLVPPEDGTAEALVRAAVALTRGGARDDDIERCEESFFAWGEPEPLRPRGRADREALGRITAPSAGAIRVSSLGEDEAPASAPEGAPSSFETLVGGADEDWKQTLQDSSAAVRRAWGRWRSAARDRKPSARQRRPRLLPLAVFAVLLVLATAGMLALLGGAPGDANPAPSSAGAMAPDPAASGQSPTPTSPPAAPVDIVGAVGELLDARRSCGSDPACVSQIAERPDLEITAGAASADRGVRQLRLLDDYGDVAVVRADAEGLPSQLVVLARHDGLWLLREVLDLAQQP